MSLREDLRELADNPVSYGQETHGELHAEALAHIERCEEVLRKIIEGSDIVRQQGLVEACRIREGLPPGPKPGFAALLPADQEEWKAMLVEMKRPDTKECGCGYPGRECLLVVLRNGPPYPPRPCEPVAAAAAVPNEPEEAT